MRYAHFIGCLPVFACAVVTPWAFAVQFSDQTIASGLAYPQHQTALDGSCVAIDIAGCEVERMSGGAAVADVDDDGDLDLFFTRLAASDVLLLNNGDGTFSDGSQDAGFAAFTAHSNGAAFADIDNDGDSDLYVTVIGPPGDFPNNRNYLFINDGSGAFSEAAAARGVAVFSSSQRHLYSVAVGDYDSDGFVDLHTSEWAGWTPSRSRLLRNRGNVQPGHFIDVTDAAGVNIFGRFAFASAFSDLDDDGHPDLAIAADFGTSRLFWNNGDGTFSDGTIAAQVGSDENGMGSTIADYDGDGDLDWFVTSIYDPDETCNFEPCGWLYSGNRLYRNDGGRLFGDATDEAGVRDGAWGWGAAFFDYDNDADLDLVMTNGVDFPGAAADNGFNSDRMRLWQNQGDGSMQEVGVAAGVTDTGSGKGLVVFDYDDDGDLDVFVVNNGASPVLYRNDGGNANAWLRVGLAGRVSNSRGLGARIMLTFNGTQQLREMGSATHFLGQSEYLSHFGLGVTAGSAGVATLDIRWPSGIEQHVAAAPVGQTIVVREPEAACVTGGVVQDDDGDGYCNSQDSCTQRYNPGQIDADGDGYGNLCDADFNNDGIVNAIDLARLKLDFFSNDPVTDINGDGVVNTADLGLVKSLFFQAPGPSGLVFRRGYSRAR